MNLWCLFPLLYSSHVHLEGIWKYVIDFCCNIDQIECHTLVARIPASYMGVPGLKYGMHAV